jgi:hypothetical protein
VSDTALLLKADDSSLVGGNVAKVLQFLGVPWEVLTVPEFLSGPANRPDSSIKAKLFCSAGAFLKLLMDLKNKPDGTRLWREQTHSVFVHAEHDFEQLQQLTRTLTGNHAASLSRLDDGGQDIIVSNEAEEVCGVMTGLRINASQGAIGGGCIISGLGEEAAGLISVGDGVTFLMIEYHEVPVFLSTHSQVVDLEAELPTGIFDIRDHILSAAPIVLYAKWAFGKACWNGAEANACLIIDDPLLKPAYGFVNFQELLSLMGHHGFSTNIAFIPWNWQRSDPKVVQLFREHPDKFSLSIHGCDHTRSEFGDHSRSRLYWKATQAVERMAWHERATGIQHDPVMVFPQGVFSEAAMSALRYTGIIAAVNNDTLSADPRPRPVRISEVWDVALMGYNGFPLFTRRYPWEGVENFAFDMLLGKPCLSVIHHDFCRDGCQQLGKFVCQINALKYPPVWRSLGEVVRRSCRQRKLLPEAIEIEMYGTQMRIENRDARPVQFRISRREPDPSAIQALNAGARLLEWDCSEGRVHFEITLNPGESQTVAVAFRGLDENRRVRESVAGKARTMLRRYLCEARDNHVMKWRRPENWGRRTES